MAASIKSSRCRIGFAFKGAILDFTSLQVKIGIRELNNSTAGKSWVNNKDKRKGKNQRYSPYKLVTRYFFNRDLQF